MTDSNPPTPSPLPGWVKLQSYSSEMEADFHAAVLGDAGIPTQIFGSNSNAVIWFWQGFNPVDIFVPAADAERAAEILAKRPQDDLEPAENLEKSPPPKDKHGHPLVPLAAFDNVQDLRDAQITLASANIPSLSPPLIPRGNRPPGQGKRFILRVSQEDLPSAKSVLEEEATEDRDQPRCPRCGSWQVHSTTGLIKGLAELTGLTKSPETAECDNCHYRGPMSDFLAKRIVN